jgi:hypothetical protein
MKRLKYLRRYIKLLKENKQLLLDSRINGNLNGVDYDWLYRLYTVLVLPNGDDLNIKKYGYHYVDNMVKNHIAKMNESLLKLGLLEYLRIDTKNVIQLDEQNIKIVLRFKWINLKRFFIGILIGIPLIIIIGLILLIIL